MPRTERHAARRKPNALLAAGVSTVDWKDTQLLRKFISDRGKIRSRRVSGLTPRQQREVATAIKNAREMALLPYPTRVQRSVRASGMWLPSAVQ